MRTIVTGAFTVHRYRDLLDAIEAAELVGIKISSVVATTGVGAAQLGVRYAEENLLELFHLARNQRITRKVADAIIVLAHRDRYSGAMAIEAQQCGLLVAVWEI